MKLIDLLVQELPKRGGWPNCACVAKSYSHIPDAIFWDDNGITVPFHSLSRLPIGDYCVTREQYEAAIAASKRPGWDGEGLPPVGMTVEWLSGQYGWLGGTVAAHDAKYPQVAIIRHNDGYAGCHRHEIRTEAERKRDQAIAQMMERSAVLVEATAGLIYDAIAAGKIPGVKLAD